MRYLPKKLVCFKLAISRATLDRLRADPQAKFPPAIKRNGRRGDRCYWVESDVEDWMKPPAHR
jgi:predicted DNA-binding transcriptional regulator AlpA